MAKFERVEKRRVHWQQSVLILLAAVAMFKVQLFGQAADPASAPASAPAAVATVVSPLAIVPLDNRVPGSAAVVTGALQVMGGKALITASGSVTSGQTTTDVDLPHRGTLRVCAATTVKLAADSNAHSGETPGLMMAMDHGAIEANVTTGQNSDMVLTPDFRILISGPGPSEVKIRLGQGGDTCVDNPRIPGGDAPYVLVTSVFDGNIYRVQPGQRVMFQHGSLQEVVDQEKEPCGCPPSTDETKGNEFPLAESEGLAPGPPVKPSPTPSTRPTRDLAAKEAPPLVYNAGDQPKEPAPQSGSADNPTAAANAAPAAPTPPTPKPKRPGIFTRMGHFFKRVFGAE